jgi:mannose-1-phosphate guanylyltransferase/mannose-6-phosphate isomerase
MNELQDVRAVILAGGSGTRLWPLSRVKAPKQFVPLMGDDTLLGATVARLAPLIAPSNVLIVTNEETASGEGYQALEPFEKIFEPAARNTAPAIAVAALRYKLEGIDPVMVVLPSDHLIRDVPGFQQALVTAVEAARSGKLLTFGIHPVTPETGYGYIEAQAGNEVPRRVRAFYEKPNLERARQFLASANFYWNSGMFVWRASAILEEIRRALPALSAVLDAIEGEARGPGGFAKALEKHFAAAPKVSIDEGVLEKSRNLYMVPGQFGWSDVGTWDAVYDVSDKDAQNNALQGSVVAIDCTNTMIRSHSRLVAALELDDIAIVETADAVLVTRRGASQNVRKVVDELVRRDAAEHIWHRTVKRPWGCYTVLQEGSGFKIKIIEVKPGGRLSLQRHKHRSEHWVVIAGTATVTCGPRESTVEVNESTFIPVGSSHRLENRGTRTLQIIEVQVGTYVGEDDIERLEDQYGRVKA